MSENEMIWRATDADGQCYEYRSQPKKELGNFYSQPGTQSADYFGHEKPPPGECWEIVQMRKGDIDTDGAPIGWKIVGIGNDGSVLCEKGNGQRRRYSFGDGANGKPSGEAWERLVAAAGAYTKEYGNQRMRVSEEARELMDAYAAYEAAQSAEPSDRQATIERLAKERDEARTERHAYKSRLREFCQRLVDMVGAEGPEDAQVMLDKVNAELHRLKQNIDSMSANVADKEGFLNSAGDEIERLTKERDEAVTELRDKLERPEMPECVRELLDAVCLEVPGLFAQKIAAVRDHYAPPLKFEVGGVYISSDERSEWELLKIARNGTMLFWGTTSEAVMRTDESGVSNIGGIKIVKRVR